MRERQLKTTWKNLCPLPTVSKTRKRSKGSKTSLDRHSRPAFRPPCSNLRTSDTLKFGFSQDCWFIRIAAVKNGKVFTNLHAVTTPTAMVLMQKQIWMVKEIEKTTLVFVVSRESTTLFVEAICVACLGHTVHRSNTFWKVVARRKLLSRN